MKYTIKNLIGSPYNVPTAKGVVHIPAHGSANVELDEHALYLVKSMHIFELSEVAERDPLDHDGDGKKGGSLPRRGRPRKDAE